MRRIALLLVAACGAQPNQPMLANAPRPNPAAVAGGAAAVAGAITLADPDAASRKTEKKQDENKKPVKVKENVPKDVLDRLDKQEAAAPARAKDAKQATPASEPAGAQKPEKPPRDALDFSQP